MAEATRAANMTKRKIDTDTAQEKNTYKQQKYNRTRLPNVEKLEASYYNKMLKEIGITKPKVNAPTPNLNQKRRKDNNAGSSTSSDKEVNKNQKQSDNQNITEIESQLQETTKSNYTSTESLTNI
ncbi:hypothetical protein PV325_007946 [Microctonus aethiopoides]|uniref:Uncharacterized protein n=1 Tax=Microctonus aethiopoides TaxID=144406 RepID=A0AA39KLB6_9HYME|nr:hypothetical protein PV325_007946 [Microctonus aethiopoides]KAK0078205.1 hypothetical protein PV326_009504 [Microctonus aethiopoides]KAK0165700.1 hypothetical protein PV328_004199 [Microctonus aethiopoides]